MDQYIRRISDTITRFVYTQKGSLINNSLLIDSPSVHQDNYAVAAHETPFAIVDVQLVEKPVIRYTTTQDPVVVTIKTVDGDRSYIENLEPFVDGLAYQACMTIQFAPDESIYGLGQDECGVYNKRGTIQYLYQHNMRIPMPFFISSKGYGVLMDCCSLMTFDDTSDVTTITLDCVDQLDFYIITGNFDEIIAGYRELTGRATRLPTWAFGYIQSKETYKTQEELVAVVEEYRRRQIPIDIIVQDWKTWEGELWGDKVLDKSRYPDVRDAILRIHEMHAHTMISIWPNMRAGGKNHEEFARKGMLLGDYSTYDAFSPEARRLYWEQIIAELKDFDSWWCDSTEPFSSPDWGGTVLLSEEVRFALVGDEHKKYLGPHRANTYALLHAKGIFENQTKDFPQKPVLNLTRSGYAGIQKYGVALWAGDTSATWRELRAEIAKGLSVSLSGLPYWTVDIGAFFAGNVECWRKWKGDPEAEAVWFWAGEYNEGVADLGYQELYTRWLQFGVFLPLFRSHGTDTPREIWHFDGIFYDAIVKFIKLRYMLMPYILEMAERVSEEHYTIMRSLMFDFSDDENVQNTCNEFMFGDNILVCPVTVPLYFEKNSRPLDSDKQMDCYLPRGADWVDFWTNAFYHGGQTVTVNASIDVIPLFVRAGSRIPTQSELQYVGEDKPIQWLDFGIDSKK